MPRGSRRRRADRERPSSRIFKTTDRGRSWRAANLTIADGEFASAVAIDPRTPSTLYAAASSGDIRVIAGGIFRSVDAGATWRPFNQSLRPRDVNALAIALTGNVLYAGTRGGGVLDYSSRGNDDGPEALAVLAYLRAIT